MHEANQLDSRVKDLEQLITGKGRDMGIGPLVMLHDKKLEEHAKDFISVKKDIRSIQDQNAKIIAYVTGAVAATTIIINLLFKFWS